MKTEIIPCPFGICIALEIDGKSFKKAENDVFEMSALAAAIGGFAQYYGAACFDIGMQYTYVNQQVKITSSIQIYIFEAIDIARRKIRWCELYVVTDNRPQRLVYPDENGIYDIKANPRKRKEEKGI